MIMKNTAQIYPPPTSEQSVDLPPGQDIGQKINGAQWGLTRQAGPRLPLAQDRIDHRINT